MGSEMCIRDRDLVASGSALCLTESAARQRFGSRLRIASLGALRKGEEPDGTVIARILFDGTAGTMVNEAIKVRDQDQFPSAPDLKRVLRSCADLQGATFGLVVDVKGAHRLVPVAEADWPYQACRIQEGGDVYVFTVGTFGIASAAYWWSRAGSGISFVPIPHREESAGLLAPHCR